MWGGRVGIPAKAGWLGGQIGEFLCKSAALGTVRSAGALVPKGL